MTTNPTNADVGTDADVGADAADRIGIIGVGEIARALVEGLCEGADTLPDVFLSPRGASAAADLSRRYSSVQVCSDNQEVVDRATVVIIAVRPQDRTDALAGLTVAGDKVVVSVMAGVGNDELRRTLDTDAPIVRAIPLPDVRRRASVTVTHPSHPAATALFDRLGGSLPVAEETSFNVFSALTATITTHYWYLATLTEWAARHGVPSADADRYVRSLFQGVGRALSDEARTLPRLAAAHETPNGINERIRTTWFDAANTHALNDALDALLADLDHDPERRSEV
ncbi:NAD(P)-binding domain-containing protein [Streptomyces sp. NPDC050315]|uniref:NAD(P)-binding domain-containing protein n=1 Tax=Streptomyces sp. NPDC050315 TaxID=3155039 RepID=UPI0034323D83